MDPNKNPRCISKIFDIDDVPASPTISYSYTSIQGKKGNHLGKNTRRMRKL